MEGNQMKMREAVEAAMTELDKFGQCHDARIHFADIVHIGRARGMLMDALSAPARNCDAGTAEEQLSRWKVYCKEGKARCLVQGKWRFINCTACFADWAQMPYTKEVGERVMLED